MGVMSRIDLDLRSAKEKGIDISDYEALLAYEELDKDTIKYIKSIGKDKWEGIVKCLI